MRTHWTTPRGELRAATASPPQAPFIPAGGARTARPLSVCRNVSVVLGRGDTLVKALVKIELTVRDGERLVLWGRSGSGKSTLLHVMSGLLAPTSGSVEWDGQPLRTLDSKHKGRMRAAGLANVFQSPNLLPHFTAYENVAFAAWAAAHDGISPADPNVLLGLVGLGDKASFLPADLSGGEAQRVAIARALAQQPRLLLCDEPTGHLDCDTGARVLALIEALQSKLGFALVIATHDADVAARYPRVVELFDGRLVRDEDRS